jgi:transcriptional regulator with XRE-family HTH domain
MYTFSNLIKKIREEAGLTQAEFAKALNVSAVLIAMVETGQKEVSKNLVLKLAETMDVHPASITPFLFINKNTSLKEVSRVEKSFLQVGERLQTYLIKKKSKKLRQYAK